MALGKATSTYGDADKVQQLVRIGSIGSEIATVLVGEVFYRQFNNRQQVDSHEGITPRDSDAGPRSRDPRISKAGNPKARTIMLELAWFWIGYQPNSALTISFRARVGTAKGRTRRIAIVAMARKLLIVLW